MARAGFVHGPPGLWKIFPKTLSGRIAFCAFSITFGTAIASSTTLYWAALRTLQWQEDQVLRQRVESAVSWLDDPTVDETMLYHEVTENVFAPRQIFLRVLDPKLSYVMETPDMGERVPPDLFPAATSAGEGVVTSIRSRSGAAYRALVSRVEVGPPDNRREVVVQAAADVSLDDQSIVWYEKVMLAIICGSFAVSCLLSWYMCRWQLSPLRRITAATRQVSSMNLDERIALDGLPVELSLLGREFNDMLERLEVTYSRLRQYADNAAHELRGPVSRMQLAAEVALRHDGDRHWFRDALETNAEEARQLARILDSVLFLARAENAGIPLDCKRISVQAELKSIRDYFAPVAEEKRIDLTLHCPADLRMWADRVLLQRAISNLVDNALSHTPSGGRIGLRASSEHDRIVIEVSDTGEGIPGSALPRVFDRFYRADGVRTAGRRVGLGLAITRSIVALHGGTIRLESRPRHGTTAHLSFSTSRPENCSSLRRA